MSARSFRVLLFFLVPGGVASQHVPAQTINKLIVEVTTGDRAFAGTDDDIHLQLGGKDFYLDNPDRDDFERGNTDRFEFSINDDRFGYDMIRGVGFLSVKKIQDGFWGGGWFFVGIKIWAESADSSPFYENNSIDKWLDGDDLQWFVGISDDAWNLPEPRRFPPCVTFGDVDDPNAIVEVDSDCDGTPDESDPTFDEPVDSDGDRLPDLYETQTGTDPNNSDSDGDGWKDGGNRRSFLILSQVECKDEDEDIGRDEIYVVSEDVRFPEDFELDGYWSMNDDTEVFPLIVIDARVSEPGTSLNFTTRLRLRESDFEFFESPTDDTVETFEVPWDDEGSTSITVHTGDYHYILTFRWFTTFFGDPTPNENGDSDDDGLREDLEFLISNQDASLRPVGESAVGGYNGLADPQRRELFVEIDASGNPFKMPFDTKQWVASQYYYHDISPRFDDGYLGGGEVLPHKEIITFADWTTYRNNNLWPERRSHFRYGLFVDKMEEEPLGLGKHGRADRPGTKFMVSRTTMLGHFSAIVLIHEMGHTLGLCHPEGTKEPPIPSPTCPTPSDWVADDEHCIHYCGVDGDDPTAMGDEVDWSVSETIGNAAIGVCAGVLIGAAIGSIFGGGPIGAIIGSIVGLVGGVIRGFLDSDAYERVVDYHTNEWANLIFDVF